MSPLFIIQIQKRILTLPYLRIRIIAEPSFFEQQPALHPESYLKQPKSDHELFISTHPQQPIYKSLSSQHNSSCLSFLHSSSLLAGVFCFQSESWPLLDRKSFTAKRGDCRRKRLKMDGCVDTMNKTREIEQEYLSLRHKVEGRIQELESRLSPNRSNHNSSSRLLSPNTSVHHRHHCYPPCYHHCHQPSCSLSRIELPTTESQLPSHTLIPPRNPAQPVSELISQALAESLRNQKQLSDNIKLLNDKIENLSAQHNRSNLSQAFSESVSRQRPVQNQRKFFRQDEKMRCRSEMKQQPFRIPRQEEQVDKPTLKRIKNKIKGSENTSSSNVLIRGRGQKGKESKASKTKSSEKFKSQYFLSFGCPVHSPNKASQQTLQKAEVYKDSEYRNRKHEKNHLLESFHQQQRSRRRLISKITHNVFNEYGRK